MKNFNYILQAITLVILFAFSAQTITAQDGDWEWLLAAGRGGNDWANDMVRDQQENLYITGAFTHTAIFGKDVNGNTITLTSLPNSLERFVAKYNKAGQCLWVKSICKIKASNSNRKGSITIDNLGNLFVGGTIYGDVIDGSDTLLHYQRGVYSFVSSFSQQDGNLKWIRIAGSGAARNDTLANEAYCTSLAPDNQGGVYSAGYFMEEMYIDSTANQKTYVKANTLSYSSFLLKYNNAGNLQWKRLIKGNTAWGAGVASIKTNSKGNVFVTGNVSGNQYIETDGQGGLDSLITDPYSAQYLISDVFILKYSPDGIFKEKTRIGGQNRQSPNDLFIDQYDNMFITGNFQYYADFSGNSITAKGSTDIFILKLDTSFNLQWDKYIQGVGEEIANYIIANDNNVYITGYFNNTIYFTETDYTTNDSLRDIFIAKYDKADGTFLSALQAGGTKDDEGWGIAIDDCENIYATGYFTSPSYFDNDTLTGSTYREIFLGKYNVHYSDFIPDASICPNKQITLTATNLAPTQFPLSWSNSQTNTNEINISPTITTTYTLTVSDADGCTASDRAIVTVLESSLCYTKLQDAYCGVVNISPNKTLYADTMQGVEMYEFEITGNDGYIQNYISNDNSFPLYKMSNLQLGETYNIRVKASVNGITLDYGTSCSITIMEQFAYNPELGEGIRILETEMDDKGNTYQNPMYLKDRFGNQFLLEEIAIPTHSHRAGHFLLHFEEEDMNLNTGFDDPTFGEARRNVVIKVFKDVSKLITVPQNGIFNSSDTNLVQINIMRSSFFYGANGELIPFQPGVLGVASSYFPFDIYPGIATNAVWKYLNTGVDPLIGLSNYPFWATNYYHGYLGFDFNQTTYNYDTIALANQNQHDFYTIVLHEALHLLGLHSVVETQNNKGKSGLGPNLYTIWDTYLYINGKPLLVGENGEHYSLQSEGYNPQIDTNLIGLLNKSCDNSLLYFKFSETDSQKVFTLANFIQGRSFSHFGCENSDDTLFALRPSLQFGYTKRVPHINEIKALCATGYNITGNFGYNNTVYNNPCNGNNTNLPNGVNDYYINATGTYRWDTSGNTRLLNVQDIIANDINTVGIADVEIVIGGLPSDLVQINDNTYQYNIPQWFGKNYALIRYRPVNSVGIKGTATYIFIRIEVPPLSPCDEKLCNLVCHGDFEDFMNVEQLRITLSHTSIDFVEKNADGIMSYSDGGVARLNWLPGYPFTGVFPNGNNNNKYVHFFQSEYLRFELVKNLKPNTTYRLIYDYRLFGEYNPMFRENAVFYLSNNDNYVFDPFENPENSTPANYLIESQKNQIYGKWVTDTILFTTNNISNFKYLIVAQVAVFIEYNKYMSTSRLIDNIELYEVDKRQIKVTSVISENNPCVGSEININYTIKKDTVSDDTLTLKTNVLGSGITIKEQGGFNSSGEITILPSEWQGDSIQKTVTLEVTSNAILGSPIFIDLDILSKKQCMSDVQIQRRDTITLGISAMDNISISKNVENGKTEYHQGDTILFNIILQNNYFSAFTQIVITDTLPDELRFINANHNVAQSGNIISFNNINLGTVEPIIIQYTCIVDGGIYACNNVTNTAYLTEGRGLCGLPIQTKKEIIIINTTSSVENAGPNKTICNGQSVMIVATGGLSYSWNNGLTNDTIIVNPNTTTTYILTISTNNCSGTDDVVIFVNPLPTANAGNDQSICQGKTATLIATGGDTYSWSNGTINDTIVVNPAVPNTYTVTVTDNNECSATDDVIVNISTPTANAGPDITVCSSQSVTLTATGGTLYSWNTNAISATITIYPNVTTTYIVTVTNDFGCSATDDVVIIIDNSITAPAKPLIDSVWGDICGDRKLYYRIGNYSEDVFYSWEIADGATIIMDSSTFDSTSNIATIKWDYIPTLTALTVKARWRNNSINTQCESTNFIDVYDCCTGNDTAWTWRNKTINTKANYANETIYINGVLTLSDTVTFKSCTLNMCPHSRIDVLPSAMIDMDSCLVQANYDYMWDSITVFEKGYAKINNSKFTDAITALRLGHSSFDTIRNCKFINNYKGIVNRGTKYNSIIAILSYYNKSKNIIGCDFSNNLLLKPISSTQHPVKYGYCGFEIIKRAYEAGVVVLFDDIYFYKNINIIKSNFSYLNFGVKVNNTNLLNIDSSNFERIYKPSQYPTQQEPTFINNKPVSAAIFADTSKVEIHNTTIKNSSLGIFNNGNLGQSVISNNSITSVGNGIYINASSSVRIDSNYISCSSSITTPYDTILQDTAQIIDYTNLLGTAIYANSSYDYGLEMAMSSYTLERYNIYGSITNNTIVSQRNGIVLNNFRSRYLHVTPIVLLIGDDILYDYPDVSMFKVRENNILIKGGLSESLQPKYYCGIYAINSRGVELNNNAIRSTVSSLFNRPTYGMPMSRSQAGFINNNRVSGFKYGTYMLNDNLETRLDSNQMDTNTTAMHFLPGTAISNQGYQYNYMTGLEEPYQTYNKWSGDGMRMSGSVNYINNSPVLWRYYIFNNDTLTYKPNIINKNNVSHMLFNPIYAKKNNRNSNKDKLSNYRDYFLNPQKLMYGTNDTVSLNKEEYNYANAEYLYQIFAEVPEILRLNDGNDKLYRDFYDSLQNTNIAKFYNIEKEIEKIAISNAQIDEANQQLLEQLEDLQNIQEQPHCNNRGGRGHHYGWGKHHKPNKNDKLEERIIKQIEKNEVKRNSNKAKYVNNAVSLNTNIIPVNTIEENKKGLNDILLNTTIKGIAIDSAKQEQLKEIALQNAIKGGEAVYIARGVLGIIIIDTIATNDTLLLQDTSIPQKKLTNIKEQNAEQNINIYPNPSNGEIIIDIQDSRFTKGTLEIYNTIGKNVATILINNKYQQINIKHLEEGIYLYKLSDKLTTLKEGKILIIKE